MQMMDSLSETRKRLDGIERELRELPASSGDIADRRSDLLEQQEVTSVSIARMDAKIKKAAQDLQINDPGAASQLRASKQNAYLDLQLRARAIKQRLRQRLINRRFEQDRLERAYRSARLGEWQGSLLVQCSCS